MNGEKDAPASDWNMEARGIRFRVEVACDGYSNLIESDVPEEWHDDLAQVEAYLTGARDAAEAIREALNKSPVTSSE